MNDHEAKNEYKAVIEGLFLKITNLEHAVANICTMMRGINQG